MKNLFNKDFYKSIGFYFAIVSIICGIIASASYLTMGASLDEYKNSSAVIPFFIGIALYIGMLLINKTQKYASFVLWVFSFISFLLFVNCIYMYFSGVFFNGISLEAFALIDKNILLSVIFYLLCLVLSNVSIYLVKKHEIKLKKVEVKE